MAALGSSDIIHPRNQGSSPEACFVEPWLERQARRAVPRPVEWTTTAPLGKRDDPEFKRVFLALYREGMTHKRMAMELGVDIRTIGRAVRSYGLQPRTLRGRTGSPHNVEFKFDLPEDLFAAMKKYCVGRHRSMADFVRRLVRERVQP